MATKRRKRGRINPNGRGERPKLNSGRGRWEARYTVWCDAAGHEHATRQGADNKRKQRLVTGRTEQECHDKLQVALAKLKQGPLSPSDEATTIGRYVEWWIAEVLPGQRRAPATTKWYRDMLRSYVVPYIGDRKLGALTPVDVERMMSALADRGLSQRVQIAARQSLGKVLKTAQREKRVSENVAWVADTPGDEGRARKVKALTVEQVGQVLGATDGSRWHRVVVTHVGTGLRPGELLALHWSDLKLDGAEPHLSVRHAITHVVGDEAQLKAPKRERSYRTVPLPAEAVAVLKAWRKTQKEERLAAGALWSDAWADLVFTNETGEPYRVDGYRHALRRLIDEANAATLKAWTERGEEPRAIPHTHPHQFRHTFATHAIEHGVPIAHVAELLGDTVATVEATYSHVLRPKHEVAPVISGLFAAAR